MTSIKIEKLSRNEALSLLKNIKNNCASGFAIQGKQHCLYITGNNVAATVTPVQTRKGFDYSNNTLEVQSGYWTSRVLKEYIYTEK